MSNSDTATRTLATHTRDMLALEEHIRVPFSAQADDGEIMLYQDVADLVSRLVAANAEHCGALRASLSGLEQGKSLPLKEAVAAIGGTVAAVIDKMQRPKVSKALRNDFTALALCTVSYGEFLTSARALRNVDIADLAQRHIADYVSLQMEISECISDVITRELADVEPNIDMKSADQSRVAIANATRLLHRD